MKKKSVAVGAEVQGCKTRKTMGVNKGRRRALGRLQHEGLLQVGLNGFNEAVCRFGLCRSGLSVGIEDVKSNLVLKKLYHERVHRTTGRRDQAEDIATILFLG